MERGFSNVHPLVGFLYYFIFFVFAFILSHPLYLGMMPVAIFIFILIKDRGNISGKLWGFYLLMAFVIFVMNPLFNPRGRTILFWFMDRPITLEAVFLGLNMGLSILTVMLGFLAYQRVMDNHKSMYLLSFIFPKLALVILMVLRFVPLLLHRIHEICSVQKLKGNLMKSGSLRYRIQGGMQIFAILVTWSLEEACKTADAMKARGYGVGKRSSYFAYRFKKRDAHMMAGVLLFAIPLIMGVVYGYGRPRIYPKLDALSLETWDPIFLFLFVIFLCIPLLEEGREFLKWRS